MPVYIDRPDRVNQGDIFRAVSFPVPPAGDPPLGMVISHDCDIDKFLAPKTPLPDRARAAFTVTAAVVHPVDDLAGSRPGDVRADRMPRYLFLPAENDLEDLCVDLWTEQPVRMVDLLDCTRVSSISTEMKNRLWFKIVRPRLGQHYRQILEGDIPTDAA